MPYKSESDFASLKVFSTFNLVYLVHITDYIELADNTAISSQNVTQKLTLGNITQQQTFAAVTKYQARIFQQ